MSDTYRVLSVPFGKRGYSVAYACYPDFDEVLTLGIKHQSEEFYPFEIGDIDRKKCSLPIP